MEDLEMTTKRGFLKSVACAAVVAIGAFQGSPAQAQGKSIVYITHSSV
jgi:hypothetical protein